VSRRLLLGRAGAGKTHACLERFTAVLEDGGRALCLVPTHSQAEHLRSLLLARRRSLARRPVATFTRFAESLTGRRLRDLASGAVRDRVAREVLRATFPQAAEQPGFRAEFLDAVKELKELGLGPAAARRHAAEHFPEGSRGRDLFLAYAAYVERLPARGRFDHEDLLLAARDRLAVRPFSCDLVAVDGFHDFTGVQKEILDLLAGHAREILVTLPLDPDNRGHPVFRTAARTAARFTGFREERLAGNRRGLAPLEARLFAPPRPPPPVEPEPEPEPEPGPGPGPGPAGKRQLSLFDAPQQAEGPKASPSVPPAAEAPRHQDRVRIDGLEVVAWPDVETEADRTARAVKASGRRYKDFLVVRRSFAGLHGIYRAAFARHGVPLRFFGREPLGRTPAARAAVLWLRHLAAPLERAELLSLLRSPYVRDRPDPADVDRLAGDLRERRETDLSAWQPARAERVRAALERPASGALPVLLAARLGVQDALLEEPDGSEEIARAARFFRLLRQEAEAVADLPLAEAAEHVAARVPHLQDSFRDRRHDCVYAVDATEARQWEKPVVFVTGLTADSFPRQVRQDLFLRDDERRALAEERDLHLPLRERREDEERYLFYVALTRARERLVLSYPAWDEEGAELPRSPYLEETLAGLDLGDAFRRVPLSQRFPQPEDAVTRRDLLPLVADGLGRARPDRVGLAASLYDRGAVPRGVLALPRRLELARALPIALPEDPAATLSASRINRYLRCPYLFLMSGVLFVRKERPEGLDPLLRGEIVHDALERIGGDPALEPGAVFDEVFGERTRGMRLGLRELHDRRWMRMAVLRAAEELRAQPVEEVEMEFSTPVGDVVLRGRIDRIDRYPEGVLVRDYKTGTVDAKKLRSLEDLQLPVYLLAVPEAGGAVFEQVRRERAVGFAVPELREFAGKAEIVSHEELAELRAHTRAIVEDTASAVRAGRLALRPRDPERCDRCDGFDLCRVAHGRWLERAARDRGGAGAGEADER